jgi:hypothetical protein
LEIFFLNIAPHLAHAWDLRLTKKSFFRRICNQFVRDGWLLAVILASPDNPLHVVCGQPLHAEIVP